MLSRCAHRVRPNERLKGGIEPDTAGLMAAFFVLARVTTSSAPDGGTRSTLANRWVRSPASSTEP